uniref:Pleckstrin homology domain containing, family J member 1like [Tribolium castaneum] n=1 Tax=Lepeophtheirus salmonis TaxID=72036 RepID=D3PHF2_LEPSM|nr:Pleckstrin homology domain-containing family J member 1 [Lepeophtheirus salmonis]
MTQSFLRVTEMRWNSNEVSDLSQKIPDWEGKMSFKTCSSSGSSSIISDSGGCKERYFKLMGNLLFYSREGQGPMGLIVLENVVSVQREIKEASLFSIVFSDDKKLLFWVANDRNAEQWITALSKASYEYQRNLLTDLRLRISQKTGKDPLSGTMFEKRPLGYQMQPSPPPRTKNKKPLISSPFNRPKASFKSHINEDIEQDLIEF